MSSSGWQGFVTQSSAPRRRPRTRWATVAGPVQTTTPSPGIAPQSRSRYGQPGEPSIPRSMTNAFSRMATKSSIGTGLPRARCSQLSASSRLPRTCSSPLSLSMTAKRKDIEHGF